MCRPLDGQSDKGEVSDKGKHFSLKRHPHAKIGNGQPNMDLGLAKATSLKELLLRDKVHTRARASLK